MLSEQELACLLEDIQRPARYIGGETNSVRKPFDSVDFRLALAFPDVYEIGMSHLGFDILYGVVNRREDSLAERVFMPWFDMERRLVETATPLFSLESRRSLGEFDVVGFSLQYELCYATVLKMLALAGIPPRRSERAGGAFPLVIAGGPCAFNAEPLADFVDLVFVGDSEETIEQFAELWKARRGEGAPAVVRAAALEIDGVYAPGLYELSGAAARPTLEGLAEVIEPACVTDLENAFFPTAPVIPLVEAVHDRIGLELMRGCSRGCRFCQAGMTRRPVRVRSVEKLMALAEESYRHTGYDEISLVSLATGDYPGLEELSRRLTHRFTPLRVSVAYPSLRADQALKVIPGSAGEVRKSALTVAVEAGSERLRNVINKGITEADLLAGLEFALQNGWRRAKLYFMAGLPTETMEDIEKIVRLVERMLALRDADGKVLSLSLSVAPFIPKPATPFQWEGMRERSYLEEARALLNDGLRSRGVKVSFHDIERSIVEAALARGGREIAPAVERAFESGAFLDAWEEGFDFSRWREAFASVGLDVEEYACRSLPIEDKTVWAHVSAGVSEDFLKRERENAFAAALTPDCRAGVCNACGLENGPCAERRPPGFG